MFSVLHEIIFQRCAILFIKWTQTDPRSAFINERYIPLLSSILCEF